MQATRRGQSPAAGEAIVWPQLTGEVGYWRFALPPTVRIDAHSSCSMPVRARHSIVVSLRIERDATMSSFRNLKPNADAISLAA